MHISAKIQPKNLKLVHYKLLAVRGNISIRSASGHPWLRPCLGLYLFDFAVMQGGTPDIRVFCHFDLTIFCQLAIIHSRQLCINANFHITVLALSNISHRWIYPVTIPPAID